MLDDLCVYVLRGERCVYLEDSSVFVCVACVYDIEPQVKVACEGSYIHIKRLYKTPPSSVIHSQT